MDPLARALGPWRTAAFPARLASVIDSKKTSEWSIALVLPAR
jgi:hypothetical protein